MFACVGFLIAEMSRLGDLPDMSSSDMEAEPGAVDEVQGDGEVADMADALDA